MIPVYIGTVEETSGRHFAAIGLGMKLKSDGLRVGYFKTYGLSPVKNGGSYADEEALLICGALGIADPPGDVCPVVMGEEAVTRALTRGVKDESKRVLAAFRRIAAKKDVVIVGETQGVCSGVISGMSEKRFIEQTDARIILTTRISDVTGAMDRIMCIKECFGTRLKGVILNRIQEPRLDYAQKLLKPFLEENGVRVYGIIGHDPTLGSVPVGELVEALGGKVIAREDKLDELVEKFMIGAMNVANALKFFRKHKNKAVITGGDRSDIQLAALETPTKCLILTGNMYPSAAILTKADEAGIPIITVASDTAETVERCEQTMGHLGMRSAQKLKRAAEIFQTQVDIAAICSDCGIKLPRG